MKKEEEEEEEEAKATYVVLRVDIEAKNTLFVVEDATNELHFALRCERPQRLHLLSTSFPHSLFLMLLILIIDDRRKKKKEEGREKMLVLMLMT